MVKTDCSQRFWSKVEKGSACWLWIAAIDDGGYGRFLFEGCNRQAHIIAWILTYGDVPDGKVVMHTCDVPNCVNLKHLILGTQLENIQDRVNKGRCFRPHGSDNSQAKLTQRQVNAIRLQYSITKCTKRSLARRYDVSDSTIGRILNGQTWL